MDTDSASELRARVRELETEMAELRDVVTETTTDREGREWTIAGLVSQFGLTRRQAIVVFGLVASGTPLVHALTRTAEAGTDSEGEIGTPDKPADAWLEDVYDKNDNAVMEFPGDGSVSVEVATIEQLAARLSFGADGYLRGLDESNSPWIEGNKRTLSDTETTDLSQTGEQGTEFGSMAFVFDRSNDQGGVFLTNVETVEQVDGNSHFSTTGGNGGTLNVIWDSGDTTLKLENQTGDIAGVNWWLFGGGT